MEEASQGRAGLKLNVLVSVTDGHDLQVRSSESKKWAHSFVRTVVTGHFHPFLVQDPPVNIKQASSGLMKVNLKQKEYNKK